MFNNCFRLPSRARRILHSISYKALSFDLNFRGQFSSVTEMSSRHGEINSKARSTTLLGSTDARSGFSSAIRTGTWAITSPSWPELLATNPDTSALFYADPDITFIAPWKFFEKWVSCGVALCADSNFPRVSLNHPWRCKWAELIAAAGLEVTNRLEDYSNSGFFGIRRQDQRFSGPLD